MIVVRAATDFRERLGDFGVDFGLTMIGVLHKDRSRFEHLLARAL